MMGSDLKVILELRSVILGQVIVHEGISVSDFRIGQRDYIHGIEIIRGYCGLLQGKIPIISCSIEKHGNRAADFGSGIRRDLQQKFLVRAISGIHLAGEPDDIFIWIIPRKVEGNVWFWDTADSEKTGIFHESFSPTGRNEILVIRLETILRGIDIP